MRVPTFIIGVFYFVDLTFALRSTFSNVVAVEGSDVTLICPAPLERPITWHKGKDPVLTLHRFRIEGSALTIFSVRKGDDGNYICGYSDGKAKEKWPVRLRIKEPPAVKELKFTDFVLNQPTKIVKKVGASLKLRCGATGNPPPEVFWVKDGTVLETPGTLSVKRLNIRGLTKDHSGIYFCIAQNDIDRTHLTYQIEVTDHVRKFIPEMTTFPATRNVTQLSNITVQVGSVATLHCRVNSEATPHIQWLKQVSGSQEENGPAVIRVGDHSYRVLQSNKVWRQDDGSFLSKLTMLNVQLNDTGLYVCLGANTMGFSYKEAYLEVISLENQEGHGIVRWVLLLTAAATTFLLVFVIGGVTYLCRRKSAIETEEPSTNREETLLNSGVVGSAKIYEERTV